MKFVIYGHLNRETGKWYIGQTSKDPYTKRFGLNR